MIKYQYEPNGDVQLEGDTVEEVEREINRLNVIQFRKFIGPYRMIGGGYAAMGKVE